MSKVYNKHHQNAPSDAVNIMRPGKWGNPYSIGKDGDRAQVIKYFRAYALSQPDYVLAIKRELKGKDLVCCCAPLPCHGDVLIEIAEGKQDD